MTIIPKRISIEISTSCNLSCGMCFLTGFRERKIMKESNYLNHFFDPALLKKLADELSENPDFGKKQTPFSLIFTGGESLLHPEIFELLEYVRKKGLRVTLFTNGTLINPQIAEKLVQTEPAALMFSIEGPEKIHDAIRGKGNFRKTYEAIKSVQSWKQMLELRSPSIFINTVINSPNVEHLQSIISLAESLNADGLSFSHIEWSDSELNALAEKEFEERLKWSNSFSRMIEAVENNLSMEKKKVEKLIAEIKAIKEKRRYNYSPRISFMPDLDPKEIRLWYLPKYRKVDFCSSVSDWIRIGVNGDVQPKCSVIPYPFGNLKENSLQEILSGARIRNFFNEIKNNGYFYACQRCCRRSSKSRSVLMARPLEKK